MGDTDKHEAIQDLRERMLRVEGSLANFGKDMAVSLAVVSKEVSGFIHEIDRRELAAKDDESTWKMEHASAVESCKAKGEIAQEAKKIAISAKSIAEKAYAHSVGSSPAAHSRTDKVAMGGLITAIVALLGAVTAYLQRALP